MLTIEKVTQKYNQLFTELDNEFFETINIGTPKQERRLRLDKLADDFNQRYADLCNDHKAELAAAGFVEPIPEPERDAFAEIDELKARIEKLERK